MHAAHASLLPRAYHAVAAMLPQNEYAALFVALIGEGPNPQGVVNTSEGKVVRAFHRFTLVDQTGGWAHARRLAGSTALSSRS